ncbi:hypothetical protein HAP41_0000041885 [Bradyrhizobium barranii subsp. apii]|uniref:Uncharacterized protein n=1 Tax=Bradyrhizobium barranii subsp. apii TaxID=2819348 RepID=A0A8T5UZ26_9BRAD|nr:hypothetical protein [Bradyrhizobium barranii]UPT86717.1 hypothetical protein HAP41_0000041885 [Bradyrhizobium barranii subsp. apii]UPT95696.1 hypothetical protein J4G48_0041935 [Bradyrhizobium barranii subsp. apii]
MKCTVPGTCTSECRARSPAKHRNQRPAMHAEDVHLAEIERQIAATAAKLRELIEQSASHLAAMSEELVGQRIDDQAARLEILIRRRDELLRARSGED